MDDAKESSFGESWARRVRENDRRAPEASTSQRVLGLLHMIFGKERCENIEIPGYEGWSIYGKPALLAKIDDGEVRPLSVSSLVNDINHYAGDDEPIAWMKQMEGSSFEVTVDLEQAEARLQQPQETGGTLERYLLWAGKHIMDRRAGIASNIMPFRTSARR